jgi:hypothetical protein
MSSALLQRRSVTAANVKRSSGRQARLNVVAFGQQGAAPEHAPRARTTPQASFTTSTMPGPQGVELGNWLRQLDLFFTKSRDTR